MKKSIFFYLSTLNPFKTMKKLVLTLFCAATMCACQEKKSDESTKLAKDTAQKTETAAKEDKKEVAKTPDYAKLILGRWAQPEDDNGFERWNFFDAEKSYSDGNETGTEYQIEGNKLIYRVLGGGEPAEYEIIELTDKKLTYKIDKDRKETWTKSDGSKESSKEKSEKKKVKIDSKLLVGTWVNPTETDEFFKQRIYKANGKMDLTPYNDIYSYKVVGNTIKYGKNEDTGVTNADDIITSLTKNELILNGNNKYKRIK